MIDMNAADEAELTEIPGIGPRIARRIVAQRDQRGGFLGIEDLLEVDGVTDALLDAIREYAVVGSDIQPDDEEHPEGVEIHRQFLAARNEGGAPRSAATLRRVRAQFRKLPGAVQRPASDLGLQPLEDDSGAADSDGGTGEVSS